MTHERREYEREKEAQPSNERQASKKLGGARGRFERAEERRARAAEAQRRARRGRQTQAA